MDKTTFGLLLLSCAQLTACATTKTVAVPEPVEIKVRVPVAVDAALTAEIPVYERDGETVREYKKQADLNTDGLRQANSRLRAIGAIKPDG